MMYFQPPANRPVTCSNRLGKKYIVCALRGINVRRAYMPPRLLIFISTYSGNSQRRKALRNSWFRYKHDPASPVPEELRQSVEIVFIASRGDKDLQHEAEAHGDIVLLDAPEGYDQLWRKALVFLSHLSRTRTDITHVMHADDDSFVRLDTLLPMLAGFPRARFYWGYIWDGTGNRVTAPIRNPANKSHMPLEQYPLDFYPPFASGCGFILSWDLVTALTAQPLPDYRLLDPPFGIHLCGPPDLCCVLGGPCTPVHEERVRPYRPIPMYRPDTLVQHYMRPEEMRPYYQQALESATSQQQGGSGGGQHIAGVDAGAGAGSAPAAPADAEPTGTSSPVAADADAAAAAEASAAPEHLYDTLVALGLLRR